MEKYKKSLTLIVCLIFAMCISRYAYAEEYASQKSGLDVIFVMDYSGSMKHNDSELIAKGMVKAFIDTVHSADLRVGFVSYNDRVLSSVSPISIETADERAALKALIDNEGYSGNTDIGLGLNYGYHLIAQEAERKKCIVLISDGESDLKGSDTGRSLENSNQDIADTISCCREEKIPIYTIAFGKYDGNTEALKNISEQTQAQMYTSENPENLIEILYGIFTTNMDYRIQEITDGLYAAGNQNIRIPLEEAYLDELDVLLISPQMIQPVTVQYGGREIETAQLKNYAVAKVADLDPEVSELMVQTQTLKNQELQIYLISYRSLVPVLNIDAKANKNSPISYQIYFKNKNGDIIADEAFYKAFQCELNFFEEGAEGQGEKLDFTIKNGILSGEVTSKHSGSYLVQGSLEDGMGIAVFEPVRISVSNRLPQGALPEKEKYTIITKPKQYRLDEYFTDPDGDKLTYSIKTEGVGCFETEITEGILNIKPVQAGTQTLLLNVFDGTDSITYEYRLKVLPLWRAYWQLIIVLAAIALLIIWKVLHKPKPELECLIEENKKNRFSGRLDAYFTAWPEGTEEIPPLSFQMYKIKDSTVTIGSLMKEYINSSNALGLDEVHLVADEEQRMVLYHTSQSSIMIGNSIVCRQIQYSVSFGDVIYITSPNESYELELHYIAMIQ